MRWIRDPGAPRAGSRIHGHPMLDPGTRGRAMRWIHDPWAHTMLDPGSMEPHSGSAISLTLRSIPA